MGSYSSSVNQSNTTYQNLPIAQENVDNPLNLVNSTGNKLGSNEVSTVLSGSASLTQNYLDGGSIGKSFDFGTKAIQLVADLTTNQNKALLESSSKAVTAIKDTANPEAAADWMQNKTFLYVAGAAAIAFFWFRKG